MCQPPIFAVVVIYLLATHIYKKLKRLRISHWSIVLVHRGMIVDFPYADFFCIAGNLTPIR